MARHLFIITFSLPCTGRYGKIKHCQAIKLALIKHAYIAAFPIYVHNSFTVSNLDSNDQTFGTDIIYRLFAGS